MYIPWIGNVTYPTQFLGFSNPGNSRFLPVSAHEMSKLLFHALWYSLIKQSIRNSITIIESIDALLTCALQETNKFIKFGNIP